MLESIIRWIATVLLALVCLAVIFYTLSSIQMLAWLRVLDRLSKKEKVEQCQKANSHNR